MKIHEVKRYECEVCHETYATKGEALRCEAQPISQDMGVRVGDIVLVTRGQGAGERCQIETVGFFGKNWGPPQYWHTPCLSGRMIDSWGNRQLSFDDYERLSV